MSKLANANQARDRAVEVIDSINAEFTMANLQKPIADRRMLADDWGSRIGVGTSGAITLYRALPPPPNIPAAREETAKMLAILPLSIDLLNETDASVARLGKLLVDETMADPAQKIVTAGVEITRTSANTLKSQSLIKRTFAETFSENSVRRHAGFFQSAVGFSAASVLEYEVGDSSPERTRETLLMQMGVMRESVRLGKAATLAERSRYLAIARDRSYAAEDRQYSQANADVMAMWLGYFDKGTEIANKLEQAAEIIAKNEPISSPTLEALFLEIEVSDRQMTSMIDEIRRRSRAL